ncbi:MAG: SMP-30/gluconolactonase/LRE family protein [Azoarcus sp.]|nr:SMP-30/gluconolactonase/LRE family protein [Azoarcus sp.]
MNATAQHRDNANPSLKVTVSTFTGNALKGYADGQGSAAQFHKPYGIAIDKAGNLYVADTFNHRIRKISPKGEVSTFAGSGPAGVSGGGLADGVGSVARFNFPNGIVIDKAGNLYVTDTYNDCIRKITQDGKVSTLAGSEEGFADGRGSSARFDGPSGIAIDEAGNLYVTDGRNHRICKVTPEGVVSTLAGGKKGYADGSGRAAQFAFPSGIAIDAAGNLYVSDFGNHRIRRVTPKGEVSTLAGSGDEGYVDGLGSAVQFAFPRGIAMDAANNLYVSDSSNHLIRKVTPKGEVSTLAGSELGFADGDGSVAEFYHPNGIAVDAAGNLYVADRDNHLVRKIVLQNVEALSAPMVIVKIFAGGKAYARGSADGRGREVLFDSPSGIAIDAAGNLYVADSGNHSIRKITPEGEVSSVAGRGENHFGAGGYADGIGVAARFNYPSDIAIDKAGNLYVADTSNNCIRKITPKGEVSTFVGSWREGSADGIGGSAQFRVPRGIAIDSAGNLYVADSGNGLIRKVTPEGKVSTFAGSERRFADGQGSSAGFSHPHGIVVDAAGNLFVADSGDSLIRKVSPNAEVSTPVGNLRTDSRRGFADGFGKNARFDDPSGIAVDATGNLYVTERRNGRIRKITHEGEVSTLAGGDKDSYAGKSGSAVQLGGPAGIVIDKTGNLYVTDSGSNLIYKIIIQ